MVRDIRAERAEVDAAARGKTVLTIFELTCKDAPDLEAHRWKDASGTWRSRSWAEYRDEVRKATAGLKALGFKPGEFAVIMSRNRPEHLVADLGVLHARGTPVSLYNTLAPEQVQYIASHCDAAVAFVEDAAFLAKFTAIRDQLPKLRHVVVTEPAGVALDEWVTSWDALMARGEEEDRRDPGAFEEWRKVTPDDLASLVYTSGTTGPPKGVMEAHSNVCWMAESVARYRAANPFRQRHISYLPFAHAFERYVGHWGAIRQQTLVAFCPDPAQLFAYAIDFKPTQLIGVPRVWRSCRPVSWPASTRIPATSGGTRSSRRSKWAASSCGPHNRASSRRPSCSKRWSGRDRSGWPSVRRSGSTSSSGGSAERPRSIPT